ncbi:hypothetical protein ABZ079_29355 [Streptomyces sp. NPDC006314]|uniref:hypothetical protein n=1 Tax=Streptomyces sp. NPDC006314 TaxID=3154475 RepID=UPI0033A436DB
MRRRQMHMSPQAQDALLHALRQLRAELKAPTEFPVHVLEAAEAAKDAVRLLWQHDLDADGNVTDSTVSRAKVRSRAKLNYLGAQQDIDVGTAEESVALLREIGKLREAVEAARDKAR